MSNQTGGVQLTGVTRRFGEVVAVDDVSVTVEQGEFFSLLGPSGCGKTTLLRLIAGFETPDAGVIRIAGRDVTASPPRERPTAMVFQSYALFPHMTVGGNIGYGLKVRGVSKAEIRAKIEAALARVQLSGLEDRPIAKLSGGQQQRVALARALAVEPDVILFDEPLSNLDLALREQTRRELVLLRKELGITSIYVTHDQEEALALSDRIAVMQSGRIRQLGTPQELFETPENAFVAGFLARNVLTAEETLKTFPQRVPDKVLSVHPAGVNLSADGSSGRLCEIVSTQYLGTHIEVVARLNGELIRSWAERDWPVGTSCHVDFENEVWVTPEDPEGHKA